MRILSARPSFGQTLLTAAAVFLAWPVPTARAHDLTLDPQALARDVQRISDTLRFYQERPAIPGMPTDDAEQRRVLGSAEIELALGHTDKALQLLMGRLSDPAFQALPEYVDTLLMTSEILEDQAEDVGAMLYSELALRRGGNPEQMAEAGARWFALARRNQRTDRLMDILTLWRAKGGAQAAGTDTAGEVMYQVGFALRQQGNRAEARAHLARVPSDGAHGSRAAYLAGVLFVEEGNLAQAERWFSAVMDWAVVADADSAQAKLEHQVRDLAALSAARLRYERGDLDGSDAAYRRITADSPFQREACWERAYLDLERGRKRGALKRLQCVVDLGARGSRAIDARLFRASLLAHMKDYDQSIRSYEHLHQDLVQERDLFTQAIANLGDQPAQFLFASMERTAVGSDDLASPGPPTLFADSWTPGVDQAYRVDRGVSQAEGELTALMNEIQVLAGAIRNESAFGGLELRKRSLEILLKEIRHLEGHGRQAMQDAARPHASSAGIVGHTHGEEAKEFRTLVSHLQGLGRTVEAEIVDVDRAGDRRKVEALGLLQGLLTDLQAIEGDLGAVRAAAEAPINGTAQQALSTVQANLTDAAMRAEFGVLDTYWLKKQHRTRAIEDLLQLRKETERQVLDAIDLLSK